MMVQPDLIALWSVASVSLLISFAFPRGAPTNDTLDFDGSRDGCLDGDL
jgi:hypothetical protein